MESEGLNIGLVLNGATLLSVAGLAAKVWLAGRPQKIEQPIEVRPAAACTPKDQCTERHAAIDRQVENIFARLGKVERDQSACDATIEAVQKQLASIDGKLDTLINARRQP